jgi:hypothetical protein
VCGTCGNGVSVQVTEPESVCAENTDILVTDNVDETNTSEGY